LSHILAIYGLGCMSPFTFKFTQNDWVFFSIQPTKNNNHVHLNHLKEWTYRECNFCQYWATRSCIHPNTMLVLEAPWITYFSSSQKVIMTTYKIVVFMDKWLGKRCFCLKCCSMGQYVVLIWWSTCNLRWFVELLVDVWSCQKYLRMDHHDLSCLWPSVLKSAHHYNLWHVI
jgi:hypothetical protein